MHKQALIQTRNRATDQAAETPVLGGPADALLVQSSRGGDQDAYGELVQRYEKRLVRTLYRLVGDWESARDLAQETFLRAYQGLDRFDASRRFGPWLFRIGVNLAVDQWRKLKKKRLLRLAEDVVSRANDAQHREIAEEVHAVLASMPEKHRTLLTLRDLEGFPCSEIAAILERREATIRWQLVGARALFRRRWERRQRVHERLRSREAAT